MLAEIEEEDKQETLFSLAKAFQIRVEANSSTNDIDSEG